MLVALHHQVDFQVFHLEVSQEARRLGSQVGEDHPEDHVRFSPAKNFDRSILIVNLQLDLLHHPAFPDHVSPNYS